MVVSVWYGMVNVPITVRRFNHEHDVFKEAAELCGCKQPSFLPTHLVVWYHSQLELDVRMFTLQKVYTCITL